MTTIYHDRYQILIAYLIREHKRAKLTQLQLAQKLNKPQSYIAKIEAKDKKLDVLEFVILCKALGVSASERLL